MVHTFYKHSLPGERMALKCPVDHTVREHRHIMSCLLVHHDRPVQFIALRDRSLLPADQSAVSFRYAVHFRDPVVLAGENNMQACHVHLAL